MTIFVSAIIRHLHMTSDLFLALPLVVDQVGEQPHHTNKSVL